MGTAPKKSRVAQLACRTADANVPASMEFLIFEENGGAFHWAIVAASGDDLVQSATFGSYEEAKQAARVVRSGAVSAPFENREADPAPLELAARRVTATVTDDLDVERWLDEGGFSSEAVTRWRLSRPVWNFGDGGPGVIVTQ
jgi:uncharacterized protein YegP (UPF0339 family)